MNSLILCEKKLLASRLNKAGNYYNYMKLIIFTTLLHLLSTKFQMSRDNSSCLKYSTTGIRKLLRAQEDTRLN